MQASLSPPTTNADQKQMGKEGRSITGSEKGKIKHRAEIKKKIKKVNRVRE